MRRRPPLELPDPVLVEPVDDSPEAPLRALIKQRALNHEHLQKIGAAVRLLYERDLGGDLQSLQAQALGAADAGLQLRHELYQIRD